VSNQKTFVKDYLLLWLELHTSPRKSWLYFILKNSQKKKRISYYSQILDTVEMDSTVLGKNPIDKTKQNKDASAGIRQDQRILFS